DHLRRGRAGVTRGVASAAGRDDESQVGDVRVTRGRAPLADKESRMFRPNMLSGRRPGCLWFALGILTAVASGGADSGTLGSLDQDRAVNTQTRVNSRPQRRNGPAPPADWVGIIGTGQSLSVGVQASTAVSTTQPFHNLRLLDEGPAPQYPLDGGGILSIIPLTEPIRLR